MASEPNPAPEGRQFWLKTAPMPGAPPSKYTSHYLRWHGSGYTTIMIMPNPPKFIRGLPDPSRILYTYNAKIWGMVMDTGMKRGGWEIVQLVQDQGAEGFCSRDDGAGLDVLTWEGGDPDEQGEGRGWRGWMVTEWANGHPQLFWVTDKLKGELPAGCERVQIIREYL